MMAGVFDDVLDGVFVRGLGLWLFCWGCCWFVWLRCTICTMFRGLVLFVNVVFL